MKKFQSLTTPHVQHDAFNILTEIYFLDKLGPIPPYSWRKGNFLASEWPHVLSILKRVLKVNKLDLEHVAGYFLQMESKIDLKKVGSFTWDLKNLTEYIQDDGFLAILYKKYWDKYAQFAGAVDKLEYAKPEMISRKKGLLNFLDSITI